MVRLGVSAPSRGGAGRTSHTTTSRLHTAPRRSLHNTTSQGPLQRRTALEEFTERQQRRNSRRDSTSVARERQRFDPEMRRNDERAARGNSTSVRVPRIGHLPSSRAPGVWRFLYCQLNSMASPESRPNKIDGIVRLIEEFDINGAVMCETGINWSRMEHHQQFSSWFDNRMEREIKTNTAHNIHGPTTSEWQQGGTAMLFTNELLQYAKQPDNDHTGLGRWCSWTLCLNPTHRTRIVVAYCPGARGKQTGLKTVANQHMTYIDAHRTDTRSPYDMFVNDLTQQLGKWRAEGDRLLVFIDANEHILQGRIARLWGRDDLDLREVTHRFWKDGEEPHTFAFGRQPIDGIFATPDLDVKNFLSLSFHESVGDHRSMIIEITTASAIGKFQGKIVRPTTRRLTTKQNASVRRYNTIIEKQFEIHRIAERIEELDEITKREGFPASDKTRQLILALNKQIDEIRLHAERRCRKIRKPAMPFSPDVKYIYDRIHAFQTLLKLKEGTKRGINARRAYRTATRCDITNPHLLSSDQCRQGIELARLRRRELFSCKTTLRKEHLRQCIRRAAQRGDDTKAKEIQRRLTAEHGRNTWRTINRIIKPNASRAVLEVQESTSAGTITHTSQATVEAAIQKECDARFHLGHSAPIAKTLLGEQLRYLRDPDIAFSIISGTYQIPASLDRATKLLLIEIGKLGRQVLRGEIKHDLMITGDDYRRYWRRVRESTSSSPSGLHYGHYKASCQSKIIPDLMAKLMNITVRSGVHPTRWGTALQVLLEKVAGVCLVDKLRSIQLYEADLNWFMKFVFNDQAMATLTASGKLPEEHFSQKESMAEDACLDKTLTMDISRQSRQPMAVLSLDAAQCYDRVHPVMMSLVWLALLNHIPAISIMLTVLQGMKFFTRTGFGDSSAFFGGDPEGRPACGLGQGSKAAPASWMQISSMIVNAFKTEGFGANMIDPITLAVTLTIGCLYVDDTDIYVFDDTLTSAHSVWRKAQAAVDLWARLLMATGGAIKAEKSFWYLLDYAQKDGEWILVRNHRQRLTVPSPSGKPAVLPPKQPDDAERTLGVLHAPCGGHTAHLDRLFSKTERWTNDIKNGHLPSTLAWLSYRRQLWPGLRYGLGTLSNNYDDASTLLNRLEFQMLPLLGVNRHIRKGWRQLPQAFGGVGLLSLPLEQIICRCSLFIQHYRTPSSLGKKIDITLHWLQLQLGTNGNPLELDYNYWNCLATDSWIKALWESLAIFPVQLEILYDTIPLPRDGDNTIMSFLRVHIGQDVATLRSINRCRCFLNLLFLSDMTTADGQRVDTSLISGTRLPRSSRMKFPREEPTDRDWQTWRRIWEIATHNGNLPCPLGAWTNTTHIDWQWFYNREDDTILYNTPDGVFRYDPPPRRRRTRADNTIYVLTRALRSLPPDARPISVSRLLSADREYAVRIEGHEGPKLHTGLNSGKPSIWDTLLSWGGGWMWLNLHFDSADNNLDWLTAAIEAGTTVWVTDGSYDVHRSPDISGAGWIAYDTASGRRFACSFAERSNQAGSYRAELLGLCSIHLFLLAIESTTAVTSKHPIKICCDNLKALEKASEDRRRIPSWMKCPDILRSLRNTKRQLSLPRRYEHVSAHMDDVLSWHQLTQTQQLNVQCDLLAKAAVARARTQFQQGNLPHTGLLPGETAAIFIDGEKVRSDPTADLQYHLGKHRAREFHVKERGWTPEQFDAVCWDSLRMALAGKSERFNLWLTKQHSNFSASRKQLARHSGSADDRCPSCIIHKEDAAHLCICPNEDRTLLLKKDADELAKWLSLDDNTHPEIAYWVPKYIMCRGAVKFVDLGKMSPAMSKLAAAQDLIGWRNFMEGRISTHFHRLQQLHLVGTSTYMTPRIWLKQFVSRILHITHSQWIFRNFMLHNSLQGYLHMNSRLELMAKIEELLETGEDEVPDDRRFLLDLELSEIEDMDFDAQNYWVQSVAAARTAKARGDEPTEVRPIEAGRHPARQSRQCTWRSKWGIAQVLEEIRKEHRDARGCSVDWWDIEATAFRYKAGTQPSVAGRTARNASNRRRKPD